ncbi:hypothetical protein [Nostoc sp. C117]|uniref:competence protein CoiA family protein n=1 Tax=Nostoc sp. C117 TaxID=3349875 RepID=UPI00370DCC6A
MYEIDIHTNKVRIVCADERYLNYYSYTFKGLCCIECKGEVFLRDGYEKRRHFAHYPAVTPSEQKCSLRIAGHANKWSSLTSEGKSQRRALFQEYFLNMIKSTDINFDNNIQMVQDRVSSDFLNLFIRNSCNYFYNNKNNLIEECSSIEEREDSKDSIWKKIITAEAIDYLSIDSSKFILETLINYSIYKYCNTVAWNWDYWLNNSKPNDIFYPLKEILINTNWSYTLYSAHKNSIPKKPKLEIHNDPLQYFVNQKSSHQFNFSYIPVTLKLTGSLINLQLNRRDSKRRLTTIAKITGCSVQNDVLIIMYTLLDDTDFINRNNLRSKCSEICKNIEDFLISALKTDLKPVFFLN